MIQTELGDLGTRVAKEGTDVGSGPLLDSSRRNARRRSMMKVFLARIYLLTSLAAVACSNGSPNGGSMSNGGGGGGGAPQNGAGTSGYVAGGAAPEGAAGVSGYVASIAGGGGSGGGGGSVSGTGGMSGGGSVGAAGASGSLGVAGSTGATDPGTDGDGSFTLTQPYKDAPEFMLAAGVPQGTVFHYTLDSTKSVIYPNAVASRNVGVYVPKQYKAGTLAAVMVFQDGTDFYGFDSNVPTVLDNLIAKGSIPPIVGVFVGNGGGDGVGSERGLEYDTVSGLYAEWVDTELLPSVEQQTEMRMPAQTVAFTHNPEGRGALGGSSGGAASFSMAWWRSDLFRRVITFSGTYVNVVADGTPFPHGCWAYHDIDPYQTAAPNGLIVAFCEKANGMKTSSDVEPCDTPLSKSACEAVTGCAWNTSANKPVRVWLEVGLSDMGASDPPSTYRNWLLANQRMAAAFKARDYHFHLDQAPGAGHVDQGPLRQTLPDALVWVWRGYQAGS
jgi:enterochelin esterase family protein